MAKSERMVYHGTVYWVQRSGRYFSSRQPVFGERLLHRRVWAEQNGEIPEGHEVHHKDRDWRNLSIDNLELMSAADHYAEHSKERSEFFTRQEREHGYLTRAREAAKLWHASPEGLAWHSQNGVKAWENRKRSECICVKCGAPFWSFSPTAKHCSGRCYQRDCVRRYFTETRACIWCGKEFVASRHRKTACCSRKCANQKRGASNRRLQPHAGPR